MFTASQGSTVNEKNANIGDWMDQSPRKKTVATEMWPAKMVSSSAENLEEDKIAPPIHTRHFHVDRTTTFSNYLCSSSPGSWLCNFVQHTRSSFGTVQKSSDPTFVLFQPFCWFLFFFFLGQIF